MSSREEKLDASAAALKAIDYISNQEFQQLEAIQKQFMWSCVYFYGFNVLEPAKTQFKGVDPRAINKQDPSNTTWLDFAYKNQVDRKFIYVNPSGKVEMGDFVSVADKIVKASDMLTGKIEIVDADYIAAYIAGLIYLGKWDSFKKFVAQGYNVYESTLNKLKTTMDERIKERLQLLVRSTGYTQDELKSSNGGFYKPAASYAPSSLKQEYIAKKGEYETKVKELFNIIKDTPSLTICYQNASIGNADVGGEDNLVYVNTNQILNCAGDLIAEEVIEDNKSETEELLKKIQELSIEIKETNERIDGIITKNDIIEMINEKIQTLGNEKLEQIEVKQKVATWVIIALVILFIMSFIMFVFCIKNSAEIKKIRIKSTNSQ